MQLTIEQLIFLKQKYEMKSFVQAQELKQPYKEILQNITDMVCL